MPIGGFTEKVETRRRVDDALAKDPVLKAHVERINRNFNSKQQQQKETAITRPSFRLENGQPPEGQRRGDAVLLGGFGGGPGRESVADFGGGFEGTYEWVTVYDSDSVGEELTTVSDSDLTQKVDMAAINQPQEKVDVSTIKQPRYITDELPRMGSAAWLDLRSINFSDNQPLSHGNTSLCGGGDDNSLYKDSLHGGGLNVSLHGVFKD